LSCTYLAHHELESVLIITNYYYFCLAARRHGCQSVDTWIPCAKHQQSVDLCEDICANDNSSHVLLSVWLVFCGSCLFVLGIYVCLQWHQLHGSVHPVLWRHLLHVCEAVEALYEVCYGLGGLAFYYYDVITSIIVLAQVRGKWPASALLAIFLVHFAITGVIVAFHGI